ERFRNLDNIDLEFDPGLTVIRGPNEAGKSSVISALLTLLFARAGTGAQTVLDHKNWGSSELFRITALLQDGEDHYQLTKDFASKSQSLSNLGSSQILKDASAIEQRICDMLGCPSEAFFRGTACIRHDEMAAIDLDKKSLSKRLQQVVTGPEDMDATMAIA